MKGLPEKRKKEYRNQAKTQEMRNRAALTETQTLRLERKVSGKPARRMKRKIPERKGLERDLTLNLYWENEGSSDWRIS